MKLEHQRSPHYQEHYILFPIPSHIHQHLFLTKAQALFFKKLTLGHKTTINLEVQDSWHPDK